MSTQIDNGRHFMGPKPLIGFAHEQTLDTIYGLQAFT